MSAFFAIAFFVNGILIPFIPVMLTDKGLTGQEIAFVLATPHVMRMFTMPVVSGLSDRAADRRRVMFSLIGLTLAMAILLVLSKGDGLVILSASLLLVLSYCVGPLADAFAMLMERAGLGDYGRMRLWGSATYILGNIVGGVALDHAGVSALYGLILFGFTIGTLSTFIIPPAQPMRREVSALSLTILRKPAFLAVLLGHAVNQGGHAALYSFGTLTWQQRGFDDVTIGMFWAVGVLAEIALFAYAARLPRSIPPLHLMTAGAVIGATRWVLFVLDTDLLTTAATQVMHAGSFCLAHIGLMRFLRDVVPEQRAASAQGTFVIFNGLAMALGTAIAGRLWPLVGDKCFYAMSAFCVLGFIILTFSRSGAKRLPSLDARAVPT